MTKNWQALSLRIIVCASFALALTTGCSDSYHPTAPMPARDLKVTSATVSVNGQVLGDGSVFHQNHAQPAGFTRFEAHLRLDGVPAPGQVVQVRYERPQGMGMMNGPTVFELYDDGSHGDRIAGDGIYCEEDRDGTYGLHHSAARHGEYRYEYYGLHTSGLESNHHVIMITVTD